MLQADVVKPFTRFTKATLLSVGRFKLLTSVSFHRLGRYILQSRSGNWLYWWWSCLVSPVKQVVWDVRGPFVTDDCDQNVILKNKKIFPSRFLFVCSYWQVKSYSKSGLKCIYFTEALYIILFYMFFLLQIEYERFVFWAKVFKYTWNCCKVYKVIFLHLWHQAFFWMLQLPNFI